MEQPMVEGRNSTAGCRVSTFDEAARALATCHARVPVPKSMPSPGPSLFMATSCVCVGVCARARARVCAFVCVCVWRRAGEKGGLRFFGSPASMRTEDPRCACLRARHRPAAPALSRPGRAPASPSAALRTSRGSRGAGLRDVWDARVNQRRRTACAAPRSEPWLRVKYEATF